MASSINLLDLSSGRTKTGVSMKFERLHLRFVVAGALLTAELIGVAAMGHPWVPVGQSMAGPIVLVAALLFFGRRRLEFRRLGSYPLSLPCFVSHLFAVCAVVLCSGAMLRQMNLGLAASPVLLVGWFIGLVLMLATVPLALAPIRQWLAFARRLGVVWFYATICALLAMSARRLELLAWDAPHSRLGEALAGGAFAGVRLVLEHFYRVSADPATRIIGVGNFRIHVAGACSGIEGITLMLFLVLGWMILERRHLRPVRVLCLLPVALGLMWALNVLRMVALIAIGAAGEPEMAIKGFHTEAGWITFTLVAVGFLAAAGRLHWLQRHPALGRKHERSPATVFLLPMVALLAVSLVTQAFSNGFESLYPIRFVVTIMVLAWLWKPLRAIRWDAGWLDGIAGLGVGILWVTFTRGGNDAAARAGLASLPAAAHGVWLMSRVCAAVLTVPIAEELAFRGFLARQLAYVPRLRGDAFEALPYREIGWGGVVLSSLAFGVTHGRLWILGTVAGIVFALLAKRRDSLGAAVAAHAVANLVLAWYALSTGNLAVW